MRVVIVSDSHGHLENVEKVIKKSGKLDMVIHLGDIIGQDDILRSMCDCTVIIVRGNCDFNSENELVEIFSLDKNKIMATHGHCYNVDWGLERLYHAAEENGCNIAMYGHTHVPEVVYQDGIWIVNPGSITRPRQYNNRPSYILMNFDKYGNPDFNINYL